MKRKVFFIMASLGTGGSERVFWLLAQGFDKQLFEVFIVHLGSGKNVLSSVLDDVKVINLNTIKASKSIFKLLKLVRLEKPYAIFSTGAHINVLVSMMSIFVKTPVIVARESNVYSEMAKVVNRGFDIWIPLIEIFYRRFNWIICQSTEINSSFLKSFRLPIDKLKIIPNPVRVVQISNFQKKNEVNNIKLLIVARLAPEKMHNRLLEIFAALPTEFHLTIAGDGPCREKLETQIYKLGLEKRVILLGEVKNVDQLYQQHQLCLLCSVTEGFPNALLESIANGTPIVSFRVGGLSNLIIQGFNGYVIDQNDTDSYRLHIIKACGQTWDRKAMMQDIQNRFSLSKISSDYQALLN
jgi:glycosyltransferase involved in cell wall biosynthesis